MDKKLILKRNREYSENYIQKVNNPKISGEIKNILIQNNIHSLIDLGCGDGLFIHAVKKEFPNLHVTGIDISPRRIDGLKKRFPQDLFLCGDVCNTKLRKKFDFVYSSQVIEHVPCDKEMVTEISRIITDDGVLYVSSVIKKPWAIYQYRNHGRFVLDPTHEREYKNSKEFLGLFKKDFKLIKCNVYPVRMPKFGFSFLIPGYYIIEGIWKKRK